MKNIYLLTILLFIAVSIDSYGQGCVAIRGNGCGGGLNSGIGLSKGEFNAQLGYRYFKSYKHFRGSHEEVERVENGTEVINKSSFVDFSLRYGITDRWFANIILPYVHHDRSSMYEHGGNPPNGLGERHTTVSSGLGDIRIGAGFWLWEPGKHDFNYSLGLGLKLPYGSYDYEDTFYNQGDDRDQDVKRVVDQSIQPGDGGTGLALDIQGYQKLNHRFGINTSVYYLFNFEETNGVLTRNGNSEFSVPDQFAVQVGSYYATMKGFSLYLGGRVEGVPAKDLIGGDAGYRRPGYAVSLEPGAGYAYKNWFLFASVPIAMYRNRIQSYEDKVRTQETGVYRHGDAAFADYLVNIGLSFRFGGGQQDAEPVDNNPFYN
uniref:transporter n=1 Tax=Fulvivirga sp. TaxID=1931237 RepID=UPI00404AB0B3